MSFDFNSLKNIKVPLWARLLGAYRARKRRKSAAKEVHYVARLTAWVHFTDTKRYSRIYYILKERGDGRRFYETQMEDDFLHYLEKSTWAYTHVVEPWRLYKYTNQQVIDWAVKQTAPHPVVFTFRRTPS